MKVSDWDFVLLSVFLKHVFKQNFTGVQCFKKLGELLQHRRKKELFDAHYLYIRDTEDPANADNTLDSTLKQNYNEGQVKIEKICEE